MIITYKIHQLTDYINWVYFFHAWGFQPRFASIATIHGCDVCRAQWLLEFSQEDRMKASEAMQLFKEANRMINELDKDFVVNTVYHLAEANSDGDNIILDNTILPLLRQQTVSQKEKHFLCLSDFVRPLSSGIKDTVGVFATTFSVDTEEFYKNDPYKHLLVQTISSRLAEAAADKLHEYIRKEAWGYAKEEDLSIQDILDEKFQGIRPAVGYPSLPDQSVNFILNDLLHMEEIGIQLTENGAMSPHASVSGLMISHPQARYFSVGKIGEDQLKDYAHRRGIEVEKLRKFLATNL